MYIQILIILSKTGFHISFLSFWNIHRGVCVGGNHDILMKSLLTLQVFEYFLLPCKNPASLPVDWANSERQQALISVSQPASHWNHIQMFLP